MEAQHIIEGLYNAAHSLVCDDPDCPWAQFFSEPREPTNERTSRRSPRDDALLMVLLRIVDSIGECLDLIRLLVENRDRARGREPSTTSSSSSDDMAVPDRLTPLGEPPMPGLYRQQWTRTPTVSPPAYTAFCHRNQRRRPSAPVSSPETSETAAASAGDSTVASVSQGGASRGDQEEQGIAEIWPATYFF
jgi:hypothetical protein